MRTNIDIDDELMSRAMNAAGASTKKATVEEGLRLLIQLKGQGRIRELRGKVIWHGPDDDWFASDEEILKRRRESEAKSAQDHHSSSEQAELESAGERAPR